MTLLQRVFERQGKQMSDRRRCFTVHSFIALVSFVRVDLNEGIASSSSNTTLIFLVTAHPDVSVVTPRCSPGVLDDVILLAARFVVTNS